MAESRDFAPLGDVTILVVAADGLLLEALRAELGRLGARLLAARDGAQALDILRTVLADALVADGELPGMTAADLARRVRSDPRWHAIPVIVLAASGSSSGADSQDDDVSARLPRPPAAEELYRAVARLVPRASPRQTLRDCLARVSAEARIVEMVRAPEHYTIRIDLAGEVGKELVLPAAVLHRAMSDARARSSVERLLRSAVLVMQSQRAIGDAHETLAGTALPSCRVCGRAITGADGPDAHPGCAGSDVDA
jgi:CheY-like chemotaxis protein